jgi:two-component system LytT family response regulator
VPEIRALIADDEPLARRGIRQLLARHPDIVVAGECRNGKEVLKAAGSHEVDLVFLDVQMPGLGGFEVLQNWGKRRMPAIVFVTAYEEFAVRAFESCALDYLVKPVTQVRFDATMTRVRERFRQGDAEALAERLKQLLAAREAVQAVQARPSAPLIVHTSTGELLLDPNEIDWIEARDYCARLHAGEHRYLIRESLRALEKRLDTGSFLRVHRRAIVRLARVRELRTSTAGGTVLLLKDGTRIPVSRRRRERLAAALRGNRD